MFARNSIVAGLLLASLVSCSVRPADAQALWNLSLDNPDQNVTAGTAGTVVFTGAIQNTDPTQTLSLFGDTLTTGNWDATLNVVEDPTFIAFLNGAGTVQAGQAYTGPLFDLTYTSATPAANIPPYDGGFEVDTDGAPNSLLVPFTLTVTPNGSGTTPEPGAFAMLTGIALFGASLLLHRRRK